MNEDEYGEIINGEETYQYIAKNIKHSVPALVGWTDQHGTHFDILFVLQASTFGSQIQGGVRGSDLFVSIMRIGAFGFDATHLNTAPGYYEEKLCVRGSLGSTREALAELINGIKKYL